MSEKPPTPSVCPPPPRTSFDREIANTSAAIRSYAKRLNLLNRWRLLYWGFEAVYIVVCVATWLAHS